MIFDQIDQSPNNVSNNDEEIPCKEETCIEECLQRNSNENNKEEPCCRELEQIKNKLAVITADFDNSKKRALKERAHWVFNGQKEIIIDLLAIVDDFDRALDSIMPSNEGVTTASITEREGFNLIRVSLYKMLEKYHVASISTTGIFDPEKHEALVQVESADHPSGTIVQVLQKGFMFNNQIIRPAKVSVAK
jgi:molecular chaperone GrpE